LSEEYCSGTWRMSLLIMLIQMIVIASIHQPSTITLLLFDNVLLLSEGKTVYYGPPDHSTRYFTSLGYPPVAMMSPAEWMLELTNTDFLTEDDQDNRLSHLLEGWGRSPERNLLGDSLIVSESSEPFSLGKQSYHGHPRSVAMQTWILFHRVALVGLS
jgi:ABC-type multidrug transport system ATPase subunit